MAAAADVEGLGKLRGREVWVHHSPLIVFEQEIYTQSFVKWHVRGLQRRPCNLEAWAVIGVSAHMARRPLAMIHPWCPS